MPFIMQPAEIPSGGVFAIQGMNYDSAQTFIRGAVLVYEAGSSGEVVEAGVNPTVIVGVALQGADTAPGFAMANNPSPITGRQRRISVCTANLQSVLQASLTNGSSTRIAPALTDVGAQYGITAYSGVWTIDRAKTGASARVQITDYDRSGRNIIFFKWLSSVIAGS